jgi:hypothetical protein
MKGSPVDRADAVRLVTATLQSWVADPGNDAVWTGEFEGKYGVRVKQTVRDYTTIWFDIGERTVAAEAYLLPPPRGDATAVYRYCLARNRTSWPAYIAIERQGDLCVMARTPTADLSVADVEMVVGAIYEVVELAFGALLKMGFGKREKTS